MTASPGSLPMLKARPSLLRGLVAACALWLLWSAAAGAASFQVSPTRFEFSLERRFTDFFNVTNNSGDALRLRITTAFIDFDPGGKLIERKDSPYDIAPWIVLNPRRITLAPGEKRVVRFTIRPPDGLKEGEYRTVVFFEEQPLRPEERKAEGTGFQISLLTRLGVTIYGRVGASAPDLTLEQPSALLEPQQVLLKGVLRNAGTAHSTFDVLATLLRADGTEQGRAQERLTLQRGQRRALELKLARPGPGAYTVKVQGRVEDKTVFAAEVPLTVPPTSQ